jgi:hypothetical protein
MRLLSRLIPVRHARNIQLLLELAVITLLAILFICLSVPAPENYTPDGLEIASIQRALFDPLYRQSGLEHERLAGVLLPIKIGLQRYGHVPMWNPYISIGEPTINNAFNYLFNPFHSLPVLLSDSFAQGTKVATFIALVIAGYNMWALAYVIGIGAVGRIAAGALYLMNGSIAGKFYAGHFQLALSLAWPPLVLAALWWTLRTKNRLVPAAFAFAFALLFFAGNIYYVLHTLICAALMIAFHLVERKPRTVSDDNTGTTHYRLFRNQNFAIRWDRLRRVGIAFTFAFGLAAIQFFPVWLTRDYVNHDLQKFNADGSLQGNYEFTQAALNHLYPWSKMSFMNWINYEVNVAVDYTYISATVFLLIGGAALVVIVRRKLSTSVQSPWKVIIISLVLALLMMIWGAGQTPLLAYLYATIPLLSEFRFLGRAHAIAALWWIVLAAVAIDVLWKTARDWLRTPASFDRTDRNRLLRAALIGLSVWLYLLIYSTNNPSSRLGMVFNNFQLLNALDERRFTSFAGAVEALWLCILAVVALDSVLMLVQRFIRVRSLSEIPVWRTLSTRLLRIGLLLAVFYGLNDIMNVNSQLYRVETPTTTFTAIYPDVRAADNSPFPAINLPHSPIAFEVYEAELRNWGVNEGWTPNSTNGLLSWEVGTVLDLPRWAVVSNAYGGASHEYSQRVVDENNFEQVACYKLENAPGDPCLLDGGMAAVLYEEKAALPYTFVAPADTLLNQPSSLRADNVVQAEVIAHRQDTIIIRAETPSTGDSYLVVQEANFPGWQVSADCVRLQAQTAQTFRDPITGDRGFIAVQMPEGIHTYTFWFEPPGFGLGIVISLATVIAIGFYLLYRKPTPNLVTPDPSG